MTGRLALSLLLALASAFALNWGFYRQHARASALPRLSPRHPLRALALLFSDPRWLSGFLVGILGWGLYILALVFGPLSLVQATSAGGIGILALLVWRWGGVPLARREWAGVGVSMVGLLALGLSLIGSGAAQAGSRGSWPAIAVWVAASAAVAAVFAGPAGRIVAPGAGLGIGAGLLYSAGDVATKAAVAGWLLFAPVVPAASGLGFALLQMGFQRGKALATAGVSTLVANGLPIAAGMVLFHEPVPADVRGVLRVLAFVAVVVGAALLTRPEQPASAAPGRRAGACPPPEVPAQEVVGVEPGPAGVPPAGEEPHAAEGHVRRDDLGVAGPAGASRLLARRVHLAVVADGPRTRGARPRYTSRWSASMIRTTSASILPCSRAQSWPQRT